MKVVLFILAGLLVLVGVVWIMQGFNVLHGSAMSGHKRYALLGGGAVVVGLVVAFLARRMKKKVA